MNLGTIDAPTLRGLIEYYEHFKDDQFDPANQEIPELTDFEQQFFQKALSTGLLTGMVNASYELGLMRLMNIACKFIARQASGKSPEEMRQFFQIPPDSDDDEDDEDDDNMRGFLGQLKLSDDK
ncbi:hypothetical protein CAEBREN_03931 [Caenorhabditis brenneri]|uniref:Skp1-related protein n=1 Tax=Caenorhabditis brenneri TaxID=135651 RepID=G0MNM8_CAEBE|nr:hypothetical protein CAEBREN_03931 [Caenorhabditis brenneri]